MTQRIFDVENKKDMQDLWGILPIGIKKVCKNTKVNTFWSDLFYQNIPSEFININWHDKTEITRPVKYDDVIGCVGWFWDGEQKPAKPHLAILWRYDNDGFWTVRRNCFEHFMTAKKSELKFYGEQDD